MKFRIRELTPGYRLEIGVPTLRDSADSAPYDPAFDVEVAWIPYGHPFGSINSAKAVAEELARAGRVVEEFDVEPVAARA